MANAATLGSCTSRLSQRESWVNLDDNVKLHDLNAGLVFENHIGRESNSELVGCNTIVGICWQFRSNDLRIYQRGLRTNAVNFNRLSINSSVKAGVFRTVNTDREPLLVRKYEIKSLPTLVVVEGGREVERIVEPLRMKRSLPV